MRVAVVCVAVGLLCGCGPMQKKPTAARAADVEAPAEEEKPAGGVVDYVTGRTQVQAGRKAMDKVRKISAEKDAEMAEMMDEKSP